VTRANQSCPVCSGTSLRTILEISGIPVFCNIQYDSEAQAIEQPVGDMTLTVCVDCHHLFNSSFDESLLQYGQTYENSLHFSATFNSFARDVASRLIDQFDLRKKRIVDIGCGKGDFLSMICELGANDGFGFDQSYEEGRAQEPARGSVRYFREYFGSDHKGIKPDLVACRHVLEHIPEPVSFLTELAAALQDSQGCNVYFEVPNALFTIRDLGIWDLIYEHCQYFTENSLRTSFVRAGFSVDSVYESFGGQFLGLDGTASPIELKAEVQRSDEQFAFDDLMDSFKSHFDQLLDMWNSKLTSLDGNVAVWGGGSKGVTFLNLLESAKRVSCLVDINPHKHEKHIPITGHKIVAPESLQQFDPKHVLIMNPLYENEIAATLESVGVDAKIHLVN